MAGLCEGGNELPGSLKATLPPAQLQEMKTNKDKARSFVLYHATQGRIHTDQISDNQVVMSLDEQNPLRLQVYRKAIGVEDALIEKGDIEGMNGNIHIINKALTPSKISAGDILRRDGNFRCVENYLDISTSTHFWKGREGPFPLTPHAAVARALSPRRVGLSPLRCAPSLMLHEARAICSLSRDSGPMERVMEKSPETLELQNPGTSYTFFVPTDQAFNRLGAARLERIMEDPTYLIKTIKNHVVENMIASESFKPDLYYDIQTRQDVVDVVRKNGKLKVNDATMTSCDILNTNGVIHVINKVLLPDQHIDG
ncbi:hypothetical protein ANN_13562 [Periplaneta americana]|uniref:FAS1 domain-containing protein n=1 Tax=Periplaneta americana TaxID=6978 RepID=A0ABQ8TK61_PERAM|nr:hypothetical protein ANN_13562 [Periplaneta americana]